MSTPGGGLAEPAARLLAGALITDADGRLLLVRADGEDGRWQLPAGQAAAGETPRQAALRSCEERIGLVPRLGGVLAVDWSVKHRRPEYLFDGGQISVNAGRRALASGRRLFTAGFVAEDDLPTALADGLLPVVRAALRARSCAKGGYLEDGQPPPVLAAMQAFGIAPAVQSGSAWLWRAERVPDELPIQQAWVWVFAPDGRIVLYLDQAGLIGLPGGTLEDYEYRDPVAAAVREVLEETQIQITDPAYLGYVIDQPPGRPAVARVRLAATIAAIGPAAPDPATGSTHRRLLVPPRLIPELCGWGRGAAGQVEAAIAAAAAVGIAEPGPAAAVGEIPASGAAW